MLTLEATMAALILISAVLFLTQFATPQQVDRGDDYSRAELQRYGQDMMRLVTTKSIKPAVGYELQLFREWNSTEDDGVKWEWDENGTEDGGGTETDEDQLVYSGVDTTWTNDHLVINESGTKNRTVWFTVKPRGGFVQAASDLGTLHRITPFDSNNKKVKTTDGDNWNFNSSNDALYNDDGYGATMVWLQNESQGVTPPIVVWLDATPDQHDGIVTINETDTTEGEISSYWQLVRFDQHNSVIVDVKDKNKQKFHVLGPGIEDGTSGEESRDGVNVTSLGEIDSTGVYQWEVSFEETSDGVSPLGGYSIHFGPGSSAGWSDSVFVNVGELATVDRQISPFDNILNPVQPNYFEDEFVPYLDEVVPRNMEYKFKVYQWDGSGDEQVVTSAEGVKLEKHEDRIPVDPVVVNRFITTSNGSHTDVYNARLWLWYR